MIYRYQTLPSTNDHLTTMAADGAPEFTAVMADEQTRGKGRAGRRWWSPGGNLYLSVLLRPRIAAAMLPRVSILASVALFRAIGDKTGKVALKWPNDLLLGNRKVAGILPTARTEGGRVHWVVIGFGANLAEPETAAPGELEGCIAYLNEVVEISSEELARRVVAELREVAIAFDGAGWEKVREEWSRQALFGPSYILKDGEDEVEGVPLGLAEDGGLIMETAEGLVTVHTGELERAGLRAQGAGRFETQNEE
jgi:BirA family biotin operon repressor/biotin-[acetyl-CoA-carboxylase] ligase